jgi:hypothetical protein
VKPSLATDELQFHTRNVLPSIIDRGKQVCVADEAAILSIFRRRNVDPSASRANCSNPPEVVRHYLIKAGVQGYGNAKMIV